MVLADPTNPLRSQTDLVSDDPRWLLVQRVVQSDNFKRASRLSSFLLFVCERKLLDQLDEINEQQIGIQVFGRQPGYNPAEDNIVRTTARLVRQRLDLFFLQEGVAEPTQIHIPKGGYVPVFQERFAVPASAVTEQQREILAEPVSEEHLVRSDMPMDHRRRSKLILAGSITGLFLILLAVLLWHSRRIQQPQRLEEALWRQLFVAGQPTNLVPGDSGLVLHENITHRNIDLTTYIQRSYDPAGQLTSAPEELQPTIMNRRYTSLPDLEFAARLAALPVVRQGSLKIRYARDLRLDDLKSGRTILVGDPEGNPWVSLFQNSLNWQFEIDNITGVHSIHNIRPKQGEQSLYLCSPTDPQHRAYALVALVHNLSNEENTLLVEGTTMAGIEAASDYLFEDHEQLRQLLRSAQRADGTIQNFEVLLETQNVGAASPRFSVIGRRLEESSSIPPTSQH